MDKLYIKKVFLIFNMLCLFIAIFCFVNVADYAFALEGDYIISEQTQCVLSVFIEDGTVNYTYGEYTFDGHYAKDIHFLYTVDNASFYSVDFTVDNNETVFGGLEEIPADNNIDIAVKQNGKINVVFNLYDNDRTKIYSTARTVFSDNEAPEVPSSEQMTDYVGPNEEYFAFIDTSATDNLSGMGRVCYCSASDNEIYEGDNCNGITLVISSPATIFVYYFDNAYNSIVMEYVYDKFDYIPPQKPVFTVTPNVDLEKTGGYASSYNVKIDFNNDVSGISKKLYSVNGQEYTEYTSDFNINQEWKSYTIIAYSVDGKGNISEKAEYTLQGKVDATPPKVANIEISYDIMGDKISTVRLEVQDTMSGVEKITVSGSEVTFANIITGIYSLDYDCYGRSALDVVAYDKVGNSTVSHIVFNYFDNEKISENVKKLADWYKTADFEKYNENAIEQIKKTFEKLNILLASTTATQENFNRLFAEADEIISGQNKFYYAVEKIPKYLSGGLTYVADRDDFEGILIGDEIKLVFNALNNNDLYVKQSGFSKGFSENFALKILHNGEEVNTLKNGIKISMNMPVGFYERNYALYDLDTGEKIEIYCINNKIEFTINKSCSLSLVISGESTVAGQNNAKTVSVFGRQISLRNFLLVLGGGIVFVVIGILVVIKLAKR